jgi:hypothetical protein
MARIVAPPEKKKTPRWKIIFYVLIAIFILRIIDGMLHPPGSSNDNSDETTCNCESTELDKVTLGKARFHANSDYDCTVKYKCVWLGENARCW